MARAISSTNDVRPTSEYRAVSPGNRPRNAVPALAKSPALKIINNGCREIVKAAGAEGVIIAVSMLFIALSGAGPRPAHHQKKASEPLTILFMF